jgi:hypothetical protein
VCDTEGLAWQLRASGVLVEGQQASPSDPASAHHAGVAWLPTLGAFSLACSRTAAQPATHAAALSRLPARPARPPARPPDQISNNCGMLHYTSGGQFKVRGPLRGRGRAREAEGAPFLGTVGPTVNKVQGPWKSAGALTASPKERTEERPTPVARRALRGHSINEGRRFPDLRRRPWSSAVRAVWVASWAPSTRRCLLGLMLIGIVHCIVPRVHELCTARRCMRLGGLVKAGPLGTLAGDLSRRRLRTARAGQQRAAAAAGEARGF